MKSRIFLIIAVFLLGWLSSMALSVSIQPVQIPSIQLNSYEAEFQDIPTINPEKSFSETVMETIERANPISRDPIERPSPQDWISEEDILVTDQGVKIDLRGAEWARFTDTNSMDPLFDAGSNAIEIVPKTSAQIKVGDIASYYSNIARTTIIHRVVEVGNDKDGWYAYFKGDNLDRRDPEKVRFDQIRRVVVAIIY